MCSVAFMTHIQLWRMFWVRVRKIKLLITQNGRLQNDICYITDLTTDACLHCSHFLTQEDKSTIIHHNLVVDSFL